MSPTNCLERVLIRCQRGDVDHSQYVALPPTDQVQAAQIVDQPYRKALRSRLAANTPDP